MSDFFDIVGSDNVSSFSWRKMLEDIKPEYLYDRCYDLRIDSETSYDLSECIERYDIDWDEAMYNLNTSCDGVPKNLLEEIRLLDAQFDLIMDCIDDLGEQKYI